MRDQQILIEWHLVDYQISPNFQNSPVEAYLQTPKRRACKVFAFNVPTSSLCFSCIPPTISYQASTQSLEPFSSDTPSSF